MRNHIRSLLFAVLNEVGIDGLLSGLNKKRRKVPILLFHRVSPFWDPFTEPLRPEFFKELLVAIKDRFRIDPLAKLIDDPSGCSESAFIVFDDATRDFGEFAWPIIKELNLPVTMFVPVRAVTERSTIWNYELFGLFLKAGVKNYTLQIEGRPFQISAKKFKSDVMRLHSELMKMTGNRLSNNLELLSRSLGEGPVTFAPLMNWEELRALNNQGLVIESHSWSHAYLPSYTDQAALETEFALPVEAITNEIGKRPRFFAFPSGGTDSNCKRIAQQWYDAAFSTKEALVGLDHLDPFDIPRINMYMPYLHENLLKAAGFHSIFVGGR